MHACMRLCAYMTCCNFAGRGAAGVCANEAKVGPRGPGTGLLCGLIKFVSTEHECVCVCVCAYMCVCIYMHICMYMDVCTVEYVFVRACILLYSLFVREAIHKTNLQETISYLYVCRCLDLHICTCMYTKRNMRALCACTIYIYIHTHTHTHIRHSPSLYDLVHIKCSILFANSRFITHPLTYSI